LNIKDNRTLLSGIESYCATRGETLINVNFYEGFRKKQAWDDRRRTNVARHASANEAAYEPLDSRIEKYLRPPALAGTGISDT
jgi:hypothetical protein